MTLRHSLQLKTWLVSCGFFYEVKHIDLLAGFIKILVKNDLHVMEYFHIQKVLVGAQNVEVGTDLVDWLGSWDFGKRVSGVSEMDVVGALAPWEVSVRAREFPKSGVVSGRTSNFMADETFVVLKVCCLLYWS